MTPLYFERQLLLANRALWIVFAILVPTMTVATLDSGEAAGALLTTLAIVGFVAAMRMNTTVTMDAVQLRYRPFFWRNVPLADIESATAVEFRPIRDWGGWGLRGLGRRKAWTTHGNRGVKLVLRDGRELTVGSQRPEALAAVLGTLIT